MATQHMISKLFKRSSSGLAVFTLALFAQSAVPVRAWAQGSSAGFARFAVSMPSLAAGQSATLLPNGRWLIAGGPIGEASDRLSMTRGDELNSSRELLSVHMAVARSGQTATVLPNGKVLILGGQTDQEELVTTAEQFDPLAMTIEPLPG